MDLALVLQLCRSPPWWLVRLTGQLKGVGYLLYSIYPLGRMKDL